MGTHATGLAGGGIQEVSHLSFLLLLFLSRLARNGSPDFLVFIFLNACASRVGQEREIPSAPVVESSAVPVEAEDAPRPSCMFSFFFSTLSTLWRFIAWRRSCEEPTVVINHLVGPFDSVFGKASKDSVKRFLRNGQHLERSGTAVPLRRWEKNGSRVFSSKSVF